MGAAERYLGFGLVASGGPRRARTMAGVHPRSASALALRYPSFRIAGDCRLPVIDGTVRLR
jgi:hypothetical protein